ncbi:hypothetical protein NDN08_005726 [Rhodosorus marinus]|uniref:Uncharacterized protein n=1 Tax=Rhodosorus marinus TaxID=101924 RepID=A0AAV8V525_9RHOD|nr:hypothetical protein NDN08_005726 [Rhodosorus marinus]
MKIISTLVAACLLLNVSVSAIAVSTKTLDARPQFQPFDVSSVEIDGGADTAFGTCVLACKLVCYVTDAALTDSWWVCVYGCPTECKDSKLYETLVVREGEYEAKISLRDASESAIREVIDDRDKGYLKLQSARCEASAPLGIAPCVKTNSAACLSLCKAGCLIKSHPGYLSWWQCNLQCMFKCIGHHHEALGALQSQKGEDPYNDSPVEVEEVEDGIIIQKDGVRVEVTKVPEESRITDSGMCFYCPFPWDPCPPFPPQFEEIETKFYSAGRV